MLVEENKLQLKYPIQFHSKDGFQSIYGQIDFGLFLELKSQMDIETKKVIWNVKIGKETVSEVTNF